MPAAAQPSTVAAKADVTQPEVIVKEIGAIRDQLDELLKRSDAIEDAYGDLAATARKAQVPATVARTHAEKISYAAAEISGHLRYAIEATRDTRIKTKSLMDAMSEAASGR